jgi:hypothetical protein
VKVPPTSSAICQGRVMGIARWRFEVYEVRPQPYGFDLRRRLPPWALDWT